MIKTIIMSLTNYWYESRPLGAHRIAHVLRDDNHDVEVVDYANTWTLEELKEFWLSRNPNDIRVLAFSHLFPISWPPVLDEFVRWVRTKWPHIRTVAGSSTRPAYNNTDHLDFYIYGFGENAVLALFKYLISNGQSPRFDLNLMGRTKVIDANTFYPAFPMRSLMVKYEDRDFLEEHEWLTIELGRGCKFECDFCNFPVLGVKGDYSRDAGDFQAQLLDAYNRFGIKNYILSDETVNDRTEKIAKFADAVENLPWEPFFTGFVRADLAISRGKQEWEELARLGLRGHFYGIESFNTASARTIGKGMDGQRLKQGLIAIRNYFKTTGNGMYRGNIGLILGLPYETYENIYQTMVWLENNWQGESFDVHSLAIPRSESYFLKSSKLSTSYKQWGYHEIENDLWQESQDPYYQKITSCLDASQKIGPEYLQQNAMGPFMMTQDKEKTYAEQYFGHSVPWKGPNMDVLQAENMVRAFVNFKYSKKFGVNSFYLARRSSGYSIEEKLQARSADTLSLYSEFDDVLLRYKSKKICCS